MTTSTQESILSDLHSIESRLDSVITFALIKFVHGILSTFFSEFEIASISSIVLLSLRGVVNFRKMTDSAFVDILNLLDKLSVMVLSQAVINLVTNDSRILKMEEQDFTMLFLAFVVTTNILIFVALITYAFQTNDAVQRSMTLLLYIYSDSVEMIINRVQLGALSAGVLSLFFYLVMLQLPKSSHSIRGFIQQYIISALNMVCINVMLQSLIDVNQSYSNLIRQSFVLLIALFFLDGANQITPLLEEARNYAIWKSSQKLFIIFKKIDISLDIMLFVSLALLYSRPIWKNLLHAVFELAMLVVVNVILDMANNYIANAYTIDKAVLLFTYVILLHKFTGMVFMQGEKSKK